MSDIAEVTEPKEKLGGWNYRLIVTHHGGALPNNYFNMEIHEVYYSKDGVPDSWTMEPVTFSGETPEEVARALTNAAADVLRYPPLIVTKDEKLVEWDGEAFTVPASGEEE